MTRPRTESPRETGLIPRTERGAGDRAAPHAGESSIRALVAVGQALIEADDPEEVFRAVLEQGTVLFDAEGSSIALLDEATQELEFFAMAGEGKTAPFRVPAGRGIGGEVIRSGRPIVCPDVQRDRKFFPTADEITGFKTRSILCCPLRQGGAIVGVMQVLNSRRPGGFSAQDLELAGVLSAMAAAAITRSRHREAARLASAALFAAEGERHQLITPRSAAMREVVRVASTAARSSSTVLILGESGTGKEVLARHIHARSGRSAGPFVAVNCVALSPSLLESELFGHEQGAFTGATGRKKGKFEMAARGTLFLDEIGDLAPELQTKLLRVLQEREFERVGGTEAIRADIRLVAATNRDLRRAMASGEFREDLFYRLNVVSVHMPPLRERPEDIPALAEHFLARASREVKRAGLWFGPEVLPLLSAYGWPGNVRELANVVERAVVLAEGPVLRVEDFPPELLDPAAPRREARRDEARPAANRRKLADEVVDLKRRRILEALAATNNNQSQAAALLGLKQPNLCRLMKSLGLRG